MILAPDKFRGSITASRFAEGLAAHLNLRGIAAECFPMSDGGEGFLDAFHGEQLRVNLVGPLGLATQARALICPTTNGALGIVESAEAIGRHLVPYPTSEMALRASSRPLGELLFACVDAGATELLVGLGGTATSDGGRGVFQAIVERGGLPVPFTVACDVEATYFGALEFTGQKGVATSDLQRVEATLNEAAASFTAITGTDPTSLKGAGAGGGVGGALLCLGGERATGAALVADKCGLTSALNQATTLITGEGALDATSLQGKVVGHLLRAAPRDCSIVIIAGTAETGTVEAVEALRPGTKVLVLDRFVTSAQSLRDPLGVATSLIDAVILVA